MVRILIGSVVFERMSHADGLLSANVDRAALGLQRRPCRDIRRCDVLPTTLECWVIVHAAGSVLTAQKKAFKPVGLESDGERLSLGSIYKTYNQLLRSYMC